MLMLDPSHIAGDEAAEAKIACSRRIFRPCIIPARGYSEHSTERHLDAVALGRSALMPFTDSRIRGKGFNTLLTCVLIPPD